MTVTSVDVNREVIDEIKRVAGLHTDREVINTALDQYLGFVRQDHAIERIGARRFTDEQIEATTVDPADA